MEWSEAQKRVIESVKGDVLVSASAGSGKTAVMIERAIRLITGKTSGRRVPVKRLLIVTFTEAVAAELKRKIADALHKEAQGSAQKDWLIEQLEDLPLAHISTLHALCADLIRGHFELLDVDPSFSVADEESAALLFAEALAETVASRERALDRDYADAVKLLGNKNSFEETIRKLYDFVVSKPDRAAFLDEEAYRLSEETTARGLFGKYFGVLSRKAARLTAEYERIVRSCESSGMGAHVAHAADTLALLRELSRCADFPSLAALAPRLCIGRCPIVGKKADAVCAETAEDYKSLNAYVKDFFADAAEIAALYRCDTPEKAANRLRYVRFLCGFLKDLIAEYDARKRQENLLDFGDLEHFAVHLLRDDATAAGLRNKFDYVCVDEYQDINEVQEYILSRLSSNNLFMVGDPKQGIYGFRLSDTDIFLGKLRRYRGGDGTARFLNANYRSCGEVLTFVNRIFDSVMSEDFGGVDYAATSRLEYGNRDCRCIGERPVRAAFFRSERVEARNELPEDGIYSVREHRETISANASAEAAYIAARIAELVGRAEITETDVNGEIVARKVRYGDIAVLFTGRSARARDIAAYLASVNIPTDASRILTEEASVSVTALVDYLRAADNPKQDFVLLGAMSGVFGSFTPDELARIRADFPDETFFYEAVERYRDERADDLAGKLKSFYGRLAAWRAEAACGTVSRLGERIAAESRFADYLAGRQDGDREALQLRNFLNALRGKSYDSSLAAFTAAVEAEKRFKVPAARGNGGDCVRLNTVHGSKGLEYPIVFFADAAAPFRLDETFKNVLWDKDYGLCVADADEEAGLVSVNYLYAVLRARKRRRLTEEKARLLYVALTRAKNMLFVTGTKYGQAKRKYPDDASCMWDWLEYAASACGGFRDRYFEESEDARENPVSVTDLKFMPPDPELYCEFSAYVRRPYPHRAAAELAIKHSVTELNESAETEADFGAPLPLFRENGAETGTAYHRVLEDIDYDCADEEAVRAAIADMTERERLTHAQAKAIDPAVILRCLRSEVIAYARRNTHLREREFMLSVPAAEILPNGGPEKILLQGTLDLLIFGEETVLVDFKFSGGDEAYLREKYRRQLDLYAYATQCCTGRAPDRKLLYVLGRDLVIEM